MATWVHIHFPDMRLDPFAPWMAAKTPESRIHEFMTVVETMFVGYLRGNPFIHSAVSSMNSGVSLQK